MKTLFENIGSLLTWDSQSDKMVELSDIQILAEDGKIVNIAQKIESAGAERVNCQNKLVTPAFVDPHTHPIFYKTRENEFEMRILGKSYMEIAEAGGGIRNSVRALREASEDELFDVCMARIPNFLKNGTTTIEAKSGYGLSFKDEIKSLKVIQRINAESPLDLIPTFLGAHEIPDEYQTNREKYISIICNEMIPYVAENNLAEFCDVFTERGVYTVAETEIIFNAAIKNGLKIRIHSDEFENLGGTALAVKMGAASADHLLVISENEIQQLANSSTVATVLPGTAFFLGHKDYAPARKLWDAGATVALATDFNPGSSMTQNMQTVMTLACTQMKLTPLEAFQAATINSAKAINREQAIGSIEIGKQADLILWDVTNYRMIPYWHGQNHIQSVFKNGTQL